MKKWVLLVSLLVVGVATLADEEEDVRFIAALQRRAVVTRNDDWFKLAREYGLGLLKEGKITGEAKRELCTRLYDILTALVKISTDAGETAAAKMYENDRAWVEKQGVGKLFKLNSIGNRLLLLQGKAEAVVNELDAKKKEEEMRQLRKEFEELNKEIEETIKAWREDVAKKFPHSDFWRFLKAKEKQAMAEEHWYRDYLEFLYAKSYYFQAKLYEGEQRKERLNTLIKKFLRFTWGEPEFEGDSEPEPREFIPKTELQKVVYDAYIKWIEEKKRRGEVVFEPEPRVTYPLLTHLAYYWMARAYFDLKDFNNALKYAKYAIQVVHTLKPPIPGVKGSGTSESDLNTTVEIVLKGNLLIAQVYKEQKRIEDAVEHLYEVMGLSGKLMDPARGDEVKYRYPDIYTHEEGLFCAMELGELLVQLKRYAEGMSVVYKIYIQQRKKRSPTGEPHPLEVVAAHRMAKIYDTMVKGGEVGELPVGQIFAVAEGYYSLQQDDKAIRAYKLALCAPGTEEEKKFFLPVALFRLGVVLQHNKRFMEAGIVFLELMKRYKDHPLYGSYIIDAARGAVAAFRKLSDADAFGAELYKLAQSECKKILPPGREDFNERIRKASQDIQKKHFDTAINELGYITEVIEEPVPGTKKKRKIPYDRYPLARALLGSAYVLKFLHTEERPEPKLLERAAAALKEALDVMAQRGIKDDLAEAMARRYLGEVYTNPHFYKEEKERWAKEAIKVLQVFERKFRNNEDIKKRGYPMHAKAKLIEAYRLAGELDAAERHFEEFARAYSTTKLFQKICMDLFKAYKEEGIEVKERNPQYATSLFRTAGKMLKEWLISRKREKRGKLSPSDQMWVAQQQAEIGQHKEARKVFNEFLARLPDLEKMDDEKFGLFLRAKTGIAQCYAEEGKFKRAAETLDQLRTVVECVSCGLKLHVVDPQKFVDDEHYRRELYNEVHYNKCPKEGIYVKCSAPKCGEKFFVSEEDMERLEESLKKAQKMNPNNPNLWRLQVVDCPKCGAALDFRDLTPQKCLRRVLDGDFPFQYKVAEFYWKAFKKSEQRDVYLRDRAMDILARLYSPLDYSLKTLTKKKAALEKIVEKQPGREKELEATRKALKTLVELHPKVVYMILLIYYNSGSYFEVVQYFEERNDGPVTTDEQWERLVPSPSFRPKMKDLYNRAKAKLKK